MNFMQFVSEYDGFLPVDELDVKALYRRAAELKNDGEGANALSIYDFVISYNPKCTSAYEGKIKIYRERGEVDQAIECCNRCVEYKRNKSRFYALRANLYAKKHQYVLALLDYSRAINFGNKKKKSYYIERGLLYNKVGRYYAAISSFNEVLKMGCDDSIVYSGIGMAYFHLKMYKEALGWLTKAIDKKGKPHLYYHRGLTYYRMHNYFKAVENFDHAIEGNSSECSSYYWRAMSYFQMKEMYKAIQDFDTVLSMKSDDYQAYYGRAKAYGYNRQNDLAIADYSKVIELKPNDRQAYYGRAHSYIHEGMYKEASKDFKKVLELHPNDFQVMGKIALLESRMSA